MPKTIKNLMTAEKLAKMDLNDILADMKVLLVHQATLIGTAYEEIDGPDKAWIKECVSLIGVMNDRLTMDVKALDVKINTRKATEEETDILNESRK